MATLRVDVRARTTGAVNSQTTLFAQVFQADGVTPLTSEVSVATNPGPGGFVTISGVSLTGLVGGSQAIWDGAQLRLRWAYTAVGAQDTTQIRVSAVKHSTERSSPAPIAGLSAAAPECETGLVWMIATTCGWSRRVARL